MIFRPLSEWTPLDHLVEARRAVEQAIWVHDCLVPEGTVTLEEANAEFAAAIARLDELEGRER